MRKLILKMSVSLDGFVGGPNGELDWIFATMDEALAQWIVEGVRSAGAHLMGSRTFRDMAAYWPTSTEIFAAPMNEIPKVVFSRRGIDPLNAGSTTKALKDARAQHGGQPPAARPSRAVEESWLRPTVLTGDLATEIDGLKAQTGKDLLAHGGASLAQSLVQLGLVDEYRLVVHPVALGRGLPLFGTLEKRLDLRLVSTTRFASGVVAHVYQPVASGA